MRDLPYIAYVCAPVDCAKEITIINSGREGVNSTEIATSALFLE